MAPKKSYHHGDLHNALLDAAEEELTEKGIEAFSLRGVAKRAGVSHTAPKHHFGDVQGLLTALTTIGYQRFIKAQEQRQVQRPPDPKTQLAAAGLGYIDFANENPALFRLMFSSQRPDKTNDELSRVSTAAFDKLAKEVQLVTKSDPYTNDSAMTDVLAVWAMVHGLADLVSAGQTGRIGVLEQANEEDREALFSELLLRTLASHP